MLTTLGDLSSLVDFWTLIHILICFLFGMFIFNGIRKTKNAVVYCIFIAILWELVENIILYDFCVIGDSSVVNLLGDLVIGDFIGFFLAYIMTRKSFK